MKPRSASAAERSRWLLLTHRKGASGSPRIDGSTRSFKASKIPGCVSVAGFCPPPIRRTRSLQVYGPGIEGPPARGRWCCAPFQSFVKPRLCRRGQPRGLHSQRTGVGISIEERLERIEAGLDGIWVNHCDRLDAAMAADFCSDFAGVVRCVFAISTSFLCDSFVQAWGRRPRRADRASRPRRSADRTERGRAAAPRHRPPSAGRPSQPNPADPRCRTCANLGAINDVRALTFRAKLLGISLSS